MFDANELAIFLKENEITSKAIYSDDPTVEDDSVEITNKISIQVGENYLSVTTDLNDGTFVCGPARRSYDDVISDIKEALS